MEKESINVFQELNIMQSKIASLFQGLMKERNEYKQNSENLNKTLKEVLLEAENLRKQNEILRQSNEYMRSIINTGIKIFKQLDFSNVNLVKDQKLALEILRKIFLDSGEKLGNEETIGRVKLNLISEENDKNEKVNVTRHKLNEEDERKEFGIFSDLDFSTKFFSDDEDNKRHMFELNESSSNTTVKNFSGGNCQNLNEAIRKPEESFLFDESSDSIPVVACPSVKQEIDHVKRSPVFKDFNGRKQEESDSNSNNSKSSPFKLINEKSGSLISPWKRRQASESSPRKGSLTPKPARKKLKIISPKTSPTPSLKKPNTRECEFSMSGVKKVAQTLLNLDYYKKRSPRREENVEDRENENCKNLKINANGGTKVTVDIEDDDILIESPRKSDHVLQDMKNENEPELNGAPLLTPPQTSDLDLDETYISSSVVQRCQLTKKHALERIIEDQTPLKRPAREKSPEYDSVPFLYRREPVRKKAERMKLPGHACDECNKYYENALGNVDTQDMKKILNKCSRHRDKYSPTIDDTPPGYWKPYLTYSNLMSPNKDDVS